MQITPRPGQLPLLHTERLVLRDIRVEDISPAYCVWVNAPEITRYLEIRHTHQTPEMVRAYVESKLADIHHSQHFGIYDEAGTRLVGSVTLTHLNHHHRYVEFSFVIGHPHAGGRGYATEALGAMCDYVFNHLNMHKMIAGYYDGHVSSAKVLTRCGFTEEGRLRGKLLDWQGQRVDHILVGRTAD